ncbi:MAG: hypothetical protein V1844_12125, partial [Pseudomonadota bacterium]
SPSALFFSRRSPFCQFYVQLQFLKYDLTSYKFQGSIQQQFGSSLICMCDLPKISKTRFEKSRILALLLSPAILKNIYGIVDISGPPKTHEWDNLLNIEVTGAARLYRAAPVWTAGLGVLLRTLNLVKLSSLDDLAKSRKSRHLVIPAKALPKDRLS